PVPSAHRARHDSAPPPRPRPELRPELHDSGVHAPRSLGPRARRARRTRLQCDRRRHGVRSRGRIPDQCRALLPGLRVLLRDAAGILAPRGDRRGHLRRDLDPLRPDHGRAVARWRALVNLLDAVAFVFQWQNLAAMLAGTMYGIVVGVLPGLGPSAGMALALPLVLKWHPATALIFMGSLYKCSNYGGSITAILVNTPGDASNAATILDASGHGRRPHRDDLPGHGGSGAGRVRAAVRPGR